MCIDTLESFISPKKTIPDQYSLMAINRIFQAIEYLHSNNLVYHDIKPSNILLDNNSIPYISVLESIKTKDYFSTKNFELDIYSSPELFELGSVSSPSDLYSFGMKIYYILEKKHKKEEKDKITLLSNTFQNIFKDCINKSPLKRPDQSRGKVSNNIIRESFVGNESNHIVNALSTSIRVQDDSSVTIIDNQIVNSKQNGICIYEAGRVEIKQTEIDIVELHGILICRAKSILIHSNTIKNCRQSSIMMFNYSNATVEYNTIFNIGKYAFCIICQSFMEAKENVIDNVKCFVKLNYKGGGDFINNHVSNCNNQLDAETSSFYFLSGNGNFLNVTNNKSRFGDSIHIDEYKSEIESEKNQMCLKCKKNKRDCILFNLQRMHTRCSR